MTREEAARVADDIAGAQVAAVKVEGGVLVIEFFHRGTDDGAHRLIMNLSSTTADAWPWPQDGSADA